MKSFLRAAAATGVAAATVVTGLSFGPAAATAAPSKADGGPTAAGLSARIQGKLIFQNRAAGSTYAFMVPKIVANAPIKYTNATQLATAEKYATEWEFPSLDATGPVHPLGASSNLCLTYNSNIRLQECTPGATGQQFAWSTVNNSYTSGVGLVPVSAPSSFVGFADDSDLLVQVPGGADSVANAASFRSVLSANVKNVDLEGQSALLDGVVQDDADSVRVSYADKDGKAKSFTAAAAGGKWQQQLSDLKLGPTTVSLEAFKGTESLSTNEITVDLVIPAVTVDEATRYIKDGANKYSYQVSEGVPGATLQGKPANASAWTDLGEVQANGTAYIVDTDQGAGSGNYEFREVFRGAPSATTSIAQSAIKADKLPTPQIVGASKYTDAGVTKFSYTFRGVPGATVTAGVAGGTAENLGTVPGSGMLRVNTKVGPTAAQTFDFRQVLAGQTSDAAQLKLSDYSDSPVGGQATLVNRELGTATVSGFAPIDATDVDVIWTDENGNVQTRSANVSKGEWDRAITGLPLGKTDVKVEAFKGSESLGVGQIEVDLSVTPLTAKGAFDDDVSTVAMITGKATANTTIIANDADGKQIATTTTDDKGEYVLAINPPSKGGVYEVTVGQRIRGTELLTPQTVELDYGKAVTITSPGPDFSLIPGEALALRGLTQAGAEVRVYEDGKPGEDLAKVAADRNGAYRLLIPKLEDREYTLVVSATTKGYNTTTATVTINEGKNDVADPTAQVSFDQDVTKKATVSGTGAAGATITVKNGATKIGAAKVAADGTWSTEIDPIGAGSYELTVEQTGIEGTQTTNTTADFGAGVAITSPTGVIAPGKTTVTGTTQPGAKVSVSAAGKTVDATVDGTNWSAELEIAPSESPVTITATQQSKGNLRTEATQQVTPEGAQAAAEVTITAPTSGTYKPGASTTVSGTATAYATVVIKNQFGATLATRTADVDGNWSFSRQYGPAAMYKLTATQTRVDGTTSSSAEFTLAPENAFKKLTLTTPEATSTYVPGRNVLFTGTATPGATITAKTSWGSTLFTTRASQTDGSWAATRGFGPSATYVITLTQTALDGTSDSITPVILTPPVHQDIALTSPTQGEGYTPGQPVTFTGTASPGASIAITSKYSGATITTATADTTGNWSVKRSFGPSAVYNLLITATDTDGTTSSTELLNFGPTK